MTLVSAVAHHESAHGIATIAAFRDAVWLPRSRPLQPVKFVEITEHAPGQWSGHTIAMNIYSTGSEDQVTPRYADLMQRHIAICLAGAAVELRVRGEHTGRRCWHSRPRTGSEPELWATICSG